MITFTPEFILYYTLKTNLDGGVMLKMNPLSTNSEIETAYKKPLLSGARTIKADLNKFFNSF
jgi:hypothetical protein